MGINYNTKIVNNGLVLYYDPANTKSYPGSGTSSTDISGNNVTGTHTNVTYSSNNKGIYTFAGNGSISFSRPTQLTTGTHITISMWAKWTTNTGGISVIQALIDNNHNIPNGFIMQDRPDLGKTLTWSAQVSAAGAQSTIIVGNGTWRHIVGTCDGSKSKLYIDGVFNAETNETSLSSPQPTVTIGRTQGYGRYLTGSIGPVAMYNRALTASEVMQNFAAHRGRFGV